MSSYYDERMTADLMEIREKVRKVSDIVQTQLDRSVQALFEMDRGLASHVVVGDREVNRRIGEIDRLCHAFIVRHAPSEEYLRRASAVLRLDVALERVGDYASSIGREVARLTEPLPESVAPEISLVADHARVSLEMALRAFETEDKELARTGKDIPEGDIERAFDGLLQVAEREERSLPDVFGYRHVCNLLMRVAEQAKNIREQTIFSISGEVAERTMFKVLFVDDHNDRASQIAEAYARSRYPESGSYSSAGFHPADAVDGDVVALLDARGLQPPASGPRPVVDVSSDRQHVVVVLGPTEEMEVPFRTTLVRWKLGEGASGDGLDGLYAEVENRVDELMTTLAGPEAA